MTKKLMPATLENVRVAFRNFSGKEGRFNREGDRNFCIFLDDDIAKQMEKDGWSIRWLQPRDEYETAQGYIQVALGYNTRGRPPRVVMVTSRGKSTLDEDMVGILDWADIVSADAIINPSHWEVNGKTGVKAYLRSLYVTIEEDELELKYGDVPDTPESASSTMMSPPWDEE